MITEIQLKTELDEQKRLLNVCQKIQKGLPDGTLVCKKSKYGYAIYKSIKEEGRIKQISIGKNGRGKDIVDALKYKRCLCRIEATLTENIKGIEKLAKVYHNLNLENIEDDISIALKSGNWSFIDYDRRNESGSLIREMYHIRLQKKPLKARTLGNSDYRKDGLKIDTGMGFSVRSKSELLICMKLQEAGLDFEYERQFEFGMVKMHPDFTIMLPHGDAVLWEHFGRMDDDEYRKSIGSKLMQYANHGYFPGENLLLTYESLRVPIDVKTVESAIEKILLYADKDRIL